MLSVFSSFCLQGNISGIKSCNIEVVSLSRDFSCWCLLYHCFDSVVSVMPQWDLEGLGGLVKGCSGSGLFLERETLLNYWPVLSEHIVGRHEKTPKITKNKSQNVGTRPGSWSTVCTAAGQITHTPTVRRILVKTTPLILEMCVWFLFFLFFFRLCLKSTLVGAA